jgi:autotransporter-associated beta strand protein
MGAVLLTSGVGALAQTWTGEGADGNWSTVDNWDAEPTFPATLTFDGNKYLTNNNNDWTAGSIVSALTFASTAGDFTLSGNGWNLAVGGTITNLGDGTRTIGTDIYLTSNQAAYTNKDNNYITNTGNGSYLDVTSGTLVLAGNLSGPVGAGWGFNGNGQGGWVKTGAGTLVLSGSNTYQGASIIDGGLVIVGSTNAFGTGAAIADGNAYQLMITSGTVELNGFDTTLKGLHQFTSDMTGLGQAGTALITNSAEQTVSLTFADGSNVYGLASVKLSGNLHLNINNKGMGSVNLNAANDFTGGVTLASYAAPTYSLYTDTGLWLQSVVVGLGTGAIEFNNGGLQTNGATSNNLSQNVTVSGTNKIKIQNMNLTVSGTWTGDGLMAFTNGYSPVNEFQADMTGFTGTLIFGAQGSHTVKLSGTNADLSNATFQAANNRTNWDGITTVSANAALVKFGDLNSWFGNETNGSASAAVYSNPSGEQIVLNTTLSGGATFEVGHLGKNSTFGGTIVDGSGPVALTKVGAGTWTLTGGNTYSGTTTVSGGVLLLSGTGSINGSSRIAVSGGELAVNSSVALTPMIDVNAGGALSGSGVIDSVVYFNAADATVTGGGFGTVGELTFSGEQVWDSFTYVWDILDTLTYDKLSFTDNIYGLELMNGSYYTLTVNNPNAVAVDHLTILSGLTSGFDADNWSITSGYELSLNGTNLVLNTIPEPSTWLLLGTGVALLACLRRRR